MCCYISSVAATDFAAEQAHPLPTVSEDLYRPVEAASNPQVTSAVHQQVKQAAVDFAID